MTVRTIALAAALAAPLAAHAQQDPEQEGSDAAREQFFSELEQAGEFSTLIAALKASDALWFLEEDEPYTLLAPTDAAFGKLPDGVVDALLTEGNRPKLNAVLERHLIPDDAMAASDVSQADVLDPASGEPLPVETKGEQVMINDAVVTQENIVLEHAVVHAIDDVLVPDIVVEAMKYREEWPETEEGEASE